MRGFQAAAPREQEQKLPTGTPGESRSGACCDLSALPPVTTCPAAAVGSSTSPSPSRTTPDLLMTRGEVQVLICSGAGEQGRLEPFSSGC